MVMLVCLFSVAKQLILCLFLGLWFSQPTEVFTDLYLSGCFIKMSIWQGIRERRENILKYTSFMTIKTTWDLLNDPYRNPASQVIVYYFQKKMFIQYAKKRHSSTSTLYCQKSILTT